MRVKRYARYILLVLSLLALLTIGILAGVRWWPRQPVAQPPPVVTINLCAQTGSLSLPDGDTIPIWGLARMPEGVAPGNPSLVAQIPGPLLEAHVGDEIQVHLYNMLDEPVSLVFPGQDMAPDYEGAPPGGSVTYSLVASTPGTFLYESGINPQKQVLMGLYVVLIVRTQAVYQAYDDADGHSAYDVEAVLVLDEIDPALHRAVASGESYNMRQYNPRYTVINGRAFPQTEVIRAAAGERVLCRYVNVGTQPYAIMVLGAEQTVIAHDGYLLNYSREGYSLLIAPGEAFDAIVSVPSDAAAGTRFPLYLRSHAMSASAGTAFPGGMMTFIVVEPEP